MDIRSLHVTRTLTLVNSFARLITSTSQIESPGTNQTIMIPNEDINCEVRPAKDEEEVQSLWEPLTKDLHWNRLPDDGRTHVYSATLDGWLMAIPKSTPYDKVHTHNGNPQGCVVVFRFSNSTGWLSFFVTTASYRRRGLGRQLFEAGMDYFHAHNVEFIGLDSVTEQRETYKRRGFVETSLIAICERLNTKNVPPAGVSLLKSERIVDLKTLSLEKIARNDLKYSGYQRTRLCTNEALFHRNDAVGLAVVDQNEDLTAWLLVRRCELGYRFGPLYADREDLASLLLRVAMENVEDKDASLIAEIWHSNESAIPVFEKLGWQWTSSFHRMWYGGKVPAAQSLGGEGERGMYAIFDAAQG